MGHWLLSRVRSSFFAALYTKICDIRPGMSEEPAQDPLLCSPWAAIGKSGEF